MFGWIFFLFGVFGIFCCFVNLLFVKEVNSKIEKRWNNLCVCFILYFI